MAMDPGASSTSLVSSGHGRNDPSVLQYTSIADVLGHGPSSPSSSHHSRRSCPVTTADDPPAVSSRTSSPTSTSAASHSSSRSLRSASSRGRGLDLGLDLGKPPKVALTSHPTTSTTSASASSTSTRTPPGGTPSAPVRVNPPIMHLPTARRPGPARSGTNRGAPRRPGSSRTAAATSQPPDPHAFAFPNLLADLLRDPQAQADLDAMAAICGRSRLSRADEYAAHREPVGAGQAGSAGPRAGSDGRRAVPDGSARTFSDGVQVHVLADADPDGPDYADFPDDGTLHAASLPHSAVSHPPYAATSYPYAHHPLDTLPEGAADPPRQRRAALGVFEGGVGRRASPGRAGAAVAVAAPSLGMAEVAARGGGRPEEEGGARRGLLRLAGGRR